MPLTPAVHPPPEGAGPARWDAASGCFAPSESLAANGCLARPPPDPPLGFALPGLTCDRLARAFTRTPLSALATRAITRQSHPAHRVSISSRLASSTRTEARHAGSSPHRVSAPSWSPDIRATRDRAYVFASRRAVHRCRLNRPSLIAVSALPELSGIG